jgi:hypothetical protein
MSEGKSIQTTFCASHHHHLEFVHSSNQHEYNTYEHGTYLLYEEQRKFAFQKKQMAKKRRQRVVVRETRGAAQKRKKFKLFNVV